LTPIDSHLLFLLLFTNIHSVYSHLLPFIPVCSHLLLLTLFYCCLLPFSPFTPVAPVYLRLLPLIVLTLVTLLSPVSRLLALLTLLPFSPVCSLYFYFSLHSSFLSFTPILLPLILFTPLSRRSRNQYKTSPAIGPLRTIHICPPTRPASVQHAGGVQYSLHR
jgi:hypothetical protein